MANDMQFCTKCGEANQFRKPNCEYCGESFSGIETSKSIGAASSSYSPTTTSRATSTPIDPMERVAQLLEQSIQAQNRTTRAVRAFVRFLFIQLSTTTLAVIIWNLAQTTVNESRCFNSGDNCSANPALILLALGVYVAGVAYSSQKGWEELKASEIR